MGILHRYSKRLALAVVIFACLGYGAFRDRDPLRVWWWDIRCHPVASDSELVGQYYQGDRLDTNLFLDLNRDGSTFILVYSRFGGGSVKGTWVRQGNWVRLTGCNDDLSNLRVVRYEQKWLLVQTNSFAAFLRYGPRDRFTLIPQNHRETLESLHLSPVD